jgi:hypothetical protein
VDAGKPPFRREVTLFETRLVEEWQPRFHSMCDGLEATAQDSAIRSAGQKLYYWVETEARFPFRTVTARFLSVGSYHMLANAVRIGWHRDYATLLANTSENSDGGG